MVALWLSAWFMAALVDTLGSSPAVAGFSLFSFLSQQAGLQLNVRICNNNNNNNNNNKNNVCTRRV